MWQISHYAECRYAECRKLVLYAECRYAECRYALCHHPECRYAECRGDLLLFVRIFSTILLLLFGVQNLSCSKPTNF